jgi:hypothetical protein
MHWYINEVIMSNKNPSSMSAIQDVYESRQFESRIPEILVLLTNFTNFNVKLQQMLFKNETCEKTFKAVSGLNLNSHLCKVFY